VGVLVAVGAVAWLRVFAPSIQVAYESASGSGWDDARGELNTTFRKAISSEVAFDEATVDLVARCVSDRAITFLNGTDCRYHFNEALTSMDDHLKSQEACLDKVGYVKKEEEFTLACFKEKLPDDWKVLRGVLAKAIAGELDLEGTTEAQRKQIAGCMAGKTVEVLQPSKCRPINREAVDASGVFNSLDTCLEDAELKQKWEGEVQTCMLPLMQEALKAAGIDPDNPTADAPADDAPAPDAPADDAPEPPVDPE
ncbi:MAG: hypothetical protein KC620_11440, partial [Myxococcales bacterium]|nr:hypothetical protein [Myxococcales bacterium]